MISKLFRLALCTTAICSLILTTGLNAAGTPSLSDQWWKHGAWQLGEPVAKTQFHLEADLSGTFITGNQKVNGINTNSLVALRKGPFSNYFRYSSSRTRSSQKSFPGFEVFSESLTIDNRVVYDFNKFVNFGIGATYGEFPDQGVESRKSSYAGVGITWYERTSFILKTTLGLVREKEEPLTGNSENSNAMLGIVELHYYLLPYLMFSENFNYTGNSSESSDFRWDSMSQFMLMINKNVSFVYNVSMRYDNRPIGMLLNPLVEKKDTVQTIGVKFTF